MKGAILLFAALVGLSQGELLGANRCTWGPGYWCDSIANAKECSAFDHCLTNTWKNNEIPQKDNDEVCQFCETVVQEVKSMLLDQKTQDEIKKFLDSACSVIPSAELSKKCTTTVNNYLSELMTIISMELNPQLVCSLMGLCSGFANQPKPATPKLAIDPVKVEPLCTDCKKFFHDIKDYILSAKTEKEIEQMIDDQICTNLGSLEDECKELVNTFLPEILDALASAYDPDMICDVFGLCLNSSLSNAKTLFHRLRLQKSPLYKAAQMHSSSEECTLCETVIGEVQALARDAKTQAEVEAFLKSEVCAKLGSMKDTCDTTVDSYGTILFEFLAEELDPKTRCTSLGFCSAASNEVKPLRVFAPPKSVSPVKVSTTCVICEFIMSEVDSLLADNATEEEIKAALDKVCKLLPETVQDQCIDFINRYSNAVIELLAHELKPEQVCTMLGLCKNTKLKAAEKSQNQVLKNDMCGVCETVIQYVETLCEDNSTVEEIEKVLEKVCNFLPSSLQQECDQIIETYGKTIIDMIISQSTPEEICTAIGLCTQKAPLEAIIKPQAMLPLGMNPCTYGPSYWCASRANAESCKTVAHCEKHGWLN